MLKKFCLLALLLLGAAVFAGDRAVVLLIVFGDPEATIDFTSQSPAVKLGDYTRMEKDRVTVRDVLVDLDDNAPTEVELEATSSVSGTARTACGGYDENGNPVWVDCTKFEVEIDGKPVPPDSHKVGEFKRYRQLAPTFRAEAGKPIKIKATFIKTTPERVAEIEKARAEHLAKVKADILARQKARREAAERAKQAAEQGEDEQE